MLLGFDSSPGANWIRALPEFFVLPLQIVQVESCPPDLHSKSPHRPLCNRHGLCQSAQVGISWKLLSRTPLHFHGIGQQERHIPFWGQLNHPNLTQTSTIRGREHSKAPALPRIQPLVPRADNLVHRHREKQACGKHREPILPVGPKARNGLALQ